MDIKDEQINQISKLITEELEKRINKENIKILKKEVTKYAEVSYNQGYTNALYCVKKGLSVLVGKETEPPLKIEDIVELVDKWYKDAEKELEQVKKEQEW